MGNGIATPKFCKRGHLKKDYPSGAWCYECGRERNLARLQKWRTENPERYRAQWERSNRNSRNNDLKRQFGITLEDYNRMFAEQNGSCKICGIHQSLLKVALHVDHDHQTKMVRGLLCKKCNSAIGFGSESIDIFKKIIAYLSGELNGK